MLKKTGPASQTWTVPLSPLGGVVFDSRLQQRVEPVSDGAFTVLFIEFWPFAAAEHLDYRPHRVGRQMIVPFLTSATVDTDVRVVVVVGHVDWSIRSRLLTSPVLPVAQEEDTYRTIDMPVVFCAMSL